MMSTPPPERSTSELLLEHDEEIHRLWQAMGQPSLQHFLVAVALRVIVTLRRHGLEDGAVREAMMATAPRDSPTLQTAMAMVVDLILDELRQRPIGEWPTREDLIALTRLETPDEGGPR
jgi:hypothetical protein